MSFDDFLSVLDDGPFEETPVDIDTFVEDPMYLGGRKMRLSPIQRECLLNMTQIYRKETLELFLTPEEVQRRWFETKNEIILMLGKGCHAPNTPVFNAETGNWQRLDSFTSPDNTVIGYTDGELKHEYATEAFLEGHGRMLRVKTRLGFEEDVYEGHKYYAWHKKDFFKRNYRNVTGPSWVEVKNLTTDYKIAIGAGFDVANPMDISTAHAKILGYVIGDGCCPSDQYGRLNVDFGENEAESMADYLAALAEAGETPVVTKHPKKKMYFVTHSRSGAAYNLVKDHGLWGTKANDKFIPDAVWKSSNEVLKQFIGALWSTDGCVYLKKTNSSVAPTAEYCTISEQLAHDVQRALLRLGIPAGLRSRIPSYTYNGEKMQGQRAYYITVNGSKNFERFAAAISLHDHKQAAVDKGMEIIGLSAYKQDMYYNNLYWDNIVSIDDIGEGEYWTMTQPGSSNYVGDGFLSHQSGKDEMSAMAIAYIVYQLLCLKDPAEYYGKPKNDNIDILNIAINATQAAQVFFKKFSNYITDSPWFQGKYDSVNGVSPAKQNQFNFIKNINVYSGHSEREAWEGYNLFAVVLDEIAGFSLESASVSGKTAEAIYKMYRASVNSRFATFGKYISLSFPRYKGDFIMQLYDKVVASKQVVSRKEVMKIDPELPDGMEGNEISIDWEEDHIDAYTAPKVYALRRPCWDVNPIVTLEEKVSEFVYDYVDALGRLACMPPDAVDAFFKDRNKIEDAFDKPNGVSNEVGDAGVFHPAFEPDPDKLYFMHVDLAQKHDRCAVALAHVDKWVKVRDVAGRERDAAPFVKVDALRFWEPKKGIEVDFTEVQEYIISLQRKGFNLKLVTFDQWRSEDMRKYLNSIGIRTDLLSIKKDQYVDMAVVMNESRLEGPDEAKLREELLQLMLLPNGKVDHPRQGYKDLSDATCGAIFNAIQRTPRDVGTEIEVRTAQDYRKAARNTLPLKDDVIVAPSQKERIPPAMQAYLASIKML